MNQSRQQYSGSQNQLACFFYGVGHGTEGVCLLVYMGKVRILLDCGLENIQPLITDSRPPADLVLCSHAHTDHARGLLELHTAFPQLPIYASEVTAKLLALNWQNNTTEVIPQFCQAVQWRSSFQVNPHVNIVMFPSGHLPGAASILLTYQTKQRIYKVLYTGDFSLSNFQLVEGLSLKDLRGLAPDVLIVEGSYGTARHPHRRQQEKHLMEQIDRSLKENQSVILPVPYLGLGQEILKLLRSHHQFTGRNLDIWVDGKVAQACDTYLDILAQLPLSVQNFAKHQSLFWDEKVRPRMRRLEAKEIPTFNSEPCIIITDRTADLNKYIDNSSHNWLVLFPQYPSELFTSSIANLSIPSTHKATIQVKSYLLAEHSDGRNTTQLIHNVRPQHVIFVHGSPSYLADLTGLEELHNRYQLHSPATGSLVELPVGDRFIQPATPTPTHYEGEIDELDSFISINLPDTISNDARWQNFADTGIVEARWQGEELVLRSLSQKELLNQSNKSKIWVDIDCCGTCKYQRNQRCWNRASPLYGFKVTSEGYCPAFEPIQLEDSEEEKSI